MRLAPAVNLSATLAPAPSGRAGVFHTLRMMRELVRQFKSDPRIIGAAASIVFTTPEKDEIAEARALFEYVRDHVRYLRDVHALETISNPVLTLARQVGDCDDQVTLLASLLESVGYATRFVMAGYRSADFEHVYLQIFLNGEWVDADPTEREPFGYAPPYPVSMYVEGA